MQSRSKVKGKGEWVEGGEVVKERRMEVSGGSERGWGGFCCEGWGFDVGRLKVGEFGVLKCRDMKVESQGVGE